MLVDRPVATGRITVPNGLTYIEVLVMLLLEIRDRELAGLSAQELGETVASAMAKEGFLWEHDALAELLVELERDAWILIAARWPEKIPEFMVEKVAQLDDPLLGRLYRAIGGLITEFTPLAGDRRTGGGVSVYGWRRAGAR